MPNNTLKNGYALLLLWFTIACSCNNSAPTFHNRLENASSPYLREHADNPVDWYEWGDSAFAKAENENKPLLVSIGYAACHWCHQMERESFMDTAVARLMNENFVCIKVDREERPDIDNVFIHACQLLNNGQAGWPLNAFALPDGKPFFVGTYYPKENWLKLIREIADTYKTRQSKVELQANALTFGIIDNDSLLVFAKDSTKINTAMYADAYSSLYKNLDLVHGGLIGTEKFPVPSLWEALLQHYYYTGSDTALKATLTTLDRMALGGIYDHLGGGFSRYTTDSLWHIPHFEKMLYDNAQLISLYSHAYQLTGKSLYKNVVIETIDFAEKNLAANNGAFYCSLNADTKDGEGAVYVWRSDEIDEILEKDQAQLFKSYYHVPNRDDSSHILYATEDESAFANKQGLEQQKLHNKLSSAKGKLLTARNKRIQPSIDDKILTSWNALMIDGYCDAYMSIGNDQYLNKSISIAKFIEDNLMSSEGHLWRTYAGGESSVTGFLEDYAFLANAFIHLYQVSFDKHWLDLSNKLVDYAYKHFYDAQSGFFFYTESNALPVRKIEIINSIMPPSNAVMAKVLYELGLLLDKPDYIQWSDKMIEKMGSEISRYASSAPAWLNLIGWKVNGSHEVAIVGDQARKINSQLQAKYFPDCLFAGGEKENLPFLENKRPSSGTLIYVCTNQFCQRPVEKVADAMGQLKAK